MFGVEGLGLRVAGFGFRVQGFGTPASREENSREVRPWRRGSALEECVHLRGGSNRLFNRLDFFYLSPDSSEREH